MAAPQIAVSDSEDYVEIDTGVLRCELNKRCDKLLAGIESLQGMPNQMANLAVHGYDPKSGRLYDIGDNAGGHLAVCMGGPQVWMELSMLLQNEQWDEMLAEIGAIYNLPEGGKTEKTDRRCA